MSTLVYSIGQCSLTLDINDAVPEIQGLAAVNNDTRVAKIIIYSSPGVEWRSALLRPGESVNIPSIPPGQRKQFALREVTRNGGATAFVPDFDWWAGFV